MSKSGAIKLSLLSSGAAGGLNGKPASTTGSTPTPTSKRPWRQIVFDPPPRDDFFLPDFGSPRMVLVVVLISELLALTFTLVRTDSPAFLTELARISLFVQWIALTSAAVLCYGRRWLARCSIPMAAGMAFALLILNTAFLSEVAFWLDQRVSAQALIAQEVPPDHWTFMLRNVGICAVVAAMLLRYFFVSHQWRRHVTAEARSRINALQARIRPHFLFNSMNTIASLTRSNPQRAEEAVEDLADLFRVTLRDSDAPLRMKEELELTRIYQRIEELRLGERLKVRWAVDRLPMRAVVPSLTVQPLLENAIYHGIEPMDGGGAVSIEGWIDEGDVVLTVTNPVGEETSRDRSSGNRLALDNIRQRLELAYGERGRVDVAELAGEYQVTLRFPYAE